MTPIYAKESVHTIRDIRGFLTDALVPGIVRVSALVALALAYLSASALVARASAVAARASALVARASAAPAVPSVLAPVFGLVSALEVGLGLVALR